MSNCVSFVHLSDIHFTKFSGDQVDLDKDLRNEILNDIRDHAKGIINKPEQILVCGDIAFSGKSLEYELAHVFLNDICKILEIPETSILCVPGNHDVDHAILRDSPGFVDTQSMIENASDLNQKLTAYFRDPMYKSFLFSHIHEYNKFASKFSCNISVDEKKLNWTKDIVLNDGSVLRISGLNSTLISSHKDSEQRKMVLGEYQIPQREEGVAHLCLCHHPLECLKDSDDMKAKLNERFRVQLYGHKHAQQVRMMDNSLVVGSGSAHPCRSEKNWRPRYNWLSICIDGAGNERKLKVRIYPRILNDTNSCFVADANNCNSGNFMEYSLKLEKWENKAVKKPEQTYTPTDIAGSVKKEPVSKKLNDPIKILIYRFLDLSFVKRSLILSELNLIDEKDEGIEHMNLLDKIVQKATENNALSVMWEKVNAAINDGAYTENPFK